tara:strand:- start:13266 stop:13856 length:591 start_codon:yes stop_codon:yes gene_type:complete
MNTSVKSYTDKQLLDRVASLPTFKGFPLGFFVIYIRSSEDTFNEFDDKRYTYYFKENMLRPKFIRVDSCTTNTGSFGLSSFKKYNSLGAAVLKSDHMVYDAFVLGVSKGRVCYREHKAWGHYRDNNKNKKVEETGPLYIKKIYAHIHGVKSRYKIIRYIQNWSTGCLVDNNTPAWLAWLNVLKGQKYLTAAILKEF